jgi:hypothetical protein
MEQVGGNHYKKLAIDPIEYGVRNKLGFLEVSIIKYVTRFRDKGGIQDLDKAIHCIERLKQYYSEEDLKNESSNK